MHLIKYPTWYIKHLGLSITLQTLHVSYPKIVVTLKIKCITYMRTEQATTTTSNFCDMSMPLNLSVSLSTHMFFCIGIRVDCRLEGRQEEAQRTRS